MPAKPEWGLGRVLQDPAGGKVSVHFLEVGEKVRVAEQNRALHGRSKAEKQRDRLIADKSAKFVAGHRREKPGEPSPQ